MLLTNSFFSVSSAPTQQYKLFLVQRDDCYSLSYPMWPDECIAHRRCLKKILVKWINEKRGVDEVAHWWQTLRERDRRPRRGNLGKDWESLWGNTQINKEQFPKQNKKPQIRIHKYSVLPFKWERALIEKWQQDSSCILFCLEIDESQKTMVIEILVTLFFLYIYSTHCKSVIIVIIQSTPAFHMQ